MERKEGAMDQRILAAVRDRLAKEVTEISNFLPKDKIEFDLADSRLVFEVDLDPGGVQGFTYVGPIRSHGLEDGWNADGKAHIDRKPAKIPEPLKTCSDLATGPNHVVEVWGTIDWEEGGTESLGYCSEGLEEMKSRREVSSIELDLRSNQVARSEEGVESEEEVSPGRREKQVVEGEEVEGREVFSGCRENQIEEGEVVEEEEGTQICRDHQFGGFESLEQIDSMRIHHPRPPQCRDTEEGANRREGFETVEGSDGRVFVRTEAEGGLEGLDLIGISVSPIISPTRGFLNAQGAEGSLSPLMD